MQWIDSFTFFLFDFDGLLVNTEHLHFQAYANMLRARGFNLEWSFEDFCNIAHQSSEGLKEQIYAQFKELYHMQPNWNILYQEKKSEYMRLLQFGKVELMAGAASFLQNVQKRKLRHCVVTHSAKEQTEVIRSQFSVLRAIPFWITREDYLNSKPAPDSYLRAIERFGKKEDRIIGFEDSLRGLKALLQTPATAVLICSSDHPQMRALLPKGVLHYESFEQLPESSLV